MNSAVAFDFPLSVSLVPKHQILFKIVHTSMMNFFYFLIYLLLFSLFFLSIEKCAHANFLSILFAFLFYRSCSLFRFAFLVWLSGRLLLVFCSIAICKSIESIWKEWKKKKRTNQIKITCLSVFEGDFYFDIENAFTHIVFVFLYAFFLSPSTYISGCYFARKCDMQFNWICLNFEYVCVSVCFFSPL